MTVYSESDKVFSPEKSAFEVFSIRYGGKMTPGELEITETEIGALILTRMDSRLDSMDGKFTGFTDETKSLRNETKNSFGRLDETTALSLVTWTK